MAKKPGNPNFTAGNRVGVLLSEPLTGERTIPVSTKLPASLKAEFDELPGTPSQKYDRP